ncbi:non-hydrolyzing UDP-N-acetylglucosamine 2-epimerase [Arundinibacter roseus]|uniref:UDP-N-acetylglucosamine 2-epimerase (non-hydrolyzing) n=1 Tax=Arundinibacter roseus TaxID=2070510 RepID=A0A4R4JYD4_9BACT|nr:UDP-N-acetylglucosamine 2-epimerase (non-hydrolyzing) [Arundinibacter roseus]TDB58649.1 UDP-N-acetylglucosamine 2-epimerase (non-hydrolyzing) [Arundinibacter roseus]
MEKKKVLLLFGTRPEAIKMAPLIPEFQKFARIIDLKICITAQHRHMLDQVLRFFDIEVDFDLNLMKPGQNLHSLTSDIIQETKKIYEIFQPDLVLVHGDTTTSMAAALSAFYLGIPVAHVEAGLRTFNKKSPFPEELNRNITGRIADYHFAPTIESKNNLLDERIDPSKIEITGNTVIDALLLGLNKIKDQKPDSIKLLIDTLPFNRPFILVTGHRRENFGEGFVSICKALHTISQSLDADIIYPVHLNPNVQDPVFKYLSNNPAIFLIEPQPYEAFIWLMNQSKLIITDSGGVQEEAPSLGKPVLVMRDTTERPEAVSAGTVILVGTDYEKIVTETISLFQNEKKYEQMSKLSNPYGDGNASKRIVNFIVNELN